MSLKIEAETKLNSDPCVLSWDGKLYVGTEDGLIHSFDDKLSPGASWPAHAVQLFALAAGGGNVYSTSNDGSIRVWSAKGDKIAEIPLTGADVGALFVSGNELYSGDEAGNVTVYENNSEKARYNLLEEVKDIGISIPFLFTVRDLDVTITEIKPRAQFWTVRDKSLFEIPNKLSCKFIQYNLTIDMHLERPENWTPGRILKANESKTRFVTRHTMEGRAPLRVAGKYLLCMARGGNNLRLHDSSVATTFKQLHEVKVSDMIVTSLAVTGDYAWTGGWDGVLRRWKITEDKLEASGSLELGTCINGLVGSPDSVSVFAILAGGRVVRIKAE